jgi:ATP-dependent DNA helicase RecG
VVRPDRGLPYQKGQLLDCKEDSSRRGPGGACQAGQSRFDDVAKSVADAAECVANATGGAVVLGIDDKTSGPSAFVGTATDAV